MKYVILSFAYRGDLETAVNAALEQGWRPVGGVAVSIKPSALIDLTTTWAQAMVLDAPQAESQQERLAHAS